MSKMKVDNSEVCHGWARFWAVDLHVHTPGSSDARDEDFGDPASIVKSAIDVGLDAIAITDHNTAAWCDQMAEAAIGTNLVVLPGFELSTSDGHLLGIWEEGTPASKLEDVLIRLGIGRQQFGQLDILGTKGMGECADEIVRAGGVAIAAHIDKERGLLGQPVQTHVNALLANTSITAFEFVKPDAPEKVSAKLAGTRHPALIQSSDAYDAGLSRHSATAIGVRRTWIKAARPDLLGISYAFDDPELRISLKDPTLVQAHPTIDGIDISGGFLPGASIELSPDLNCFLGGTGAGKSLVLEAVRFALDQQVDPNEFGPIREEVDLRLAYALRGGTEVRVRVRVDGESYQVRRTFDPDGSRAIVEQDLDNEWVVIERDPSSLMSIAAFSQGEILEYARRPVGRVGLIDSHLNLVEIETRANKAESSLANNASDLISARSRVAELTELAVKVKALETREKELSVLFDPALVKEQGLWTAELGELKNLREQVAALAFVAPVPPGAVSEKIAEHKKQYERISVALNSLAEAITRAEKLIQDGISVLKDEVRDVRKNLDAEYRIFIAKLDETLKKSGNTSLASLRRELESIQTSLAKAQSASTELRDIAQPALDYLESAREILLNELKKARDERRSMRRTRIRGLNAKTAGFVKLDIPAKGDSREFRAALDIIKVGSRLNEGVLSLIAENVHPYSFVRALWTGDTSKVGKL
ncbi:MAG: AAA family ATPase, partial [Microbacteriaceae bacterium]